MTIDETLSTIVGDLDALRSQIVNGTDLIQAVPENKVFFKEQLQARADAIVAAKDLIDQI